MRKVWTIGAGLSAVAFILVGLGWLWAPGLVSARLRMPLLEGDGLSTQIGDLAAFFLTMGGAILIALRTNRSVWLYPPIWTCNGFAPVSYLTMPPWLRTRAG